MKLFLEVKESEGRKFYYTDIGAETHFRPSFRLWVHRDLVKRDNNGTPFIEFPVHNARVDTGKSSRTKILWPDPGYWILGRLCLRALRIQGRGFLHGQGRGKSRASQVQGI